VSKEEGEGGKEWKGKVGFWQAWIVGWSGAKVLPYLFPVGSRSPQDT
jgi:hypothetical protein